jgi:DNA-binding NtrC family response regulator
MQEASSVVMVSGAPGTNLALRKVLNEGGIHVREVRSCAEARRALNGLKAPVVLFSDTSLPDGTWADVLALAAEGERQIPVIVVSRVVDINLYINALEEGACDFIVPPFYRQDISHVMSCATQKNVAVQALATA